MHLLHYVPQRRADIDIVEDVLPLNGVRIGLRLPEPPRSVSLAPGGEALTWHHDGGYAWAEVERVEGHAHVVFE